MLEIITEKNCMIPMRDGVRLATDVYRLDSSTPLPVLVARTPYNKENTIAHGAFDVYRAVQAGYVVVIQDVRGRYASEGVFNPHFQETQDGVDTFAWVATQSWSNGNVGTFGGSYLGGTQWLPAREAPSSLKALAPLVTFSDAYEGCAYQGGAKVLHDLRWVVADIVPAEIKRHPEFGVEKLDGFPTVEEAFTELPLASNPLIRKYAAFYLDWLAHPSAGKYWLSASPCAGYREIPVPALNISGWYDIFLWGTFQNYLGMRQKGRTEEARRNQRIIIGPWTHMNFTGIFPERVFGKAGDSTSIDLMGIHVRWFDRWMKGIRNGVDEEPPVMIFVMGTDEWYYEPDWPLPDTQYRSYYLHSQGNANSLNGNGLLSSEDLPNNEVPDVFLYDPMRPVPTIGGQVLLLGNNAMGPRDQREVELRDDVLVYSTPVLKQEVKVIGPIELKLFVSSSAPDTDFTGKLVDVYPDGRAFILTEGILRARYRNSVTEPELFEAGCICELRINLWMTANVFLPGHSIRLEVSSSNFPRFNRNSNTGGNIFEEPREHYQTALNCIYHDAAHPSQLILPIIER
ncbi:MAG: CocE/NonD family hydrolase [Sphaerochaetaceae bacterium]